MPAWSQDIVNRKNREQKEKEDTFAEIVKIEEEIAKDPSKAKGRYGLGRELGQKKSALGDDYEKMKAEAERKKNETVVAAKNGTATSASTATDAPKDDRGLFANIVTNLASRVGSLAGNAIAGLSDKKPEQVAPVASTSTIADFGYRATTADLTAAASKNDTASKKPQIDQFLNKAKEITSWVEAAKLQEMINLEITDPSKKLAVDGDIGPLTLAALSSLNDQQIAKLKPLFQPVVSNIPKLDGVTGGKNVENPTVQENNGDVVKPKSKALDTRIG